MESREARWFLAHRRQDDDNDINYWCKCLADMLTSCPEWQAKVIPGRDDYEMRASAIGGWKTWCRDVPCGSRYDGEPMFHGVIVPADSHIEAPIVGKATAQMVGGFLDEGKHTFVWCPQSHVFRRVVAVEETEEDNWKAWASLILADET